MWHFNESWDPNLSCNNVCCLLERLQHWRNFVCEEDCHPWLCLSLTVPNLLPILLRWRVKSFLFSSWAQFFLNKSTNLGRKLLIFYTNEQEWTEMSKKIVRIYRNQHTRCNAPVSMCRIYCRTRTKTKANYHEYLLYSSPPAPFALSSGTPVSLSCTNDLVELRTQNSVRTTRIM